MKNHAVTLSAALEEVTRTLSATSLSARLDAEILLMHLSGMTRASLITRGSEFIDPQQYEKLQQLVARRQTGEPIAYLTGTREFWSLPLKVSPAVLIPRPETELLVECALACISHSAENTVVDLGTGSGAIALAIAHERPHCRIIATDTSADALDVARSNAYRLGIRNIEFHLSNWFESLTNKQFDLIVSNPPYVRADDPHLHEGDVRFEPQIALISGHDGLNAIRHIAAAARERLRESGWLLLEHGYNQALDIADILRDSGFREITSHHDLAGHVRVTTAR